MSALPAKIVLKGTTSKTLNDRFTEIARQIKSPPQVTLSGLRKGQMEQAQASVKNRRLAAQMANRPGVQAALGSPPQERMGGKVQNRLGNQNKGSVQGRLGANKTAGFRPVNRGGAVQQRIGRGSQRRGVGFRRGGVATTNRGGMGRGRPGRGGITRGIARGMRGGMHLSRGKPSRGAGVARGSQRGFGRGRGAQTNPPKSKDLLDRELDEYMTHSKGHLDAELDQYMQSAATDE